MRLRRSGSSASGSGGRGWCGELCVRSVSRRPRSALPASLLRCSLTRSHGCLLFPTAAQMRAVEHTDTNATSKDSKTRDAGPRAEKHESISRRSRLSRNHQPACHSGTSPDLCERIVTMFGEHNTGRALAPVTTFLWRAEWSRGIRHARKGVTCPTAQSLFAVYRRCAFSHVRCPVAGVAVSCLLASVAVFSLCRVE